MVDIVRPSELDAATAVVSSDAILIDTGLVLQKATAAQIVDAGRPNASEAEAIAGTDNFKRMSPLRVKQAIDGSAIAADAAEALAAAEAALATVSGQGRSVASFGAIGDGVTDDTAALQAAINYANTPDSYLFDETQNTYKTTASLTATISGVMRIDLGRAKIVCAANVPAIILSAATGSAFSITTNYVKGSTNIAVPTLGFTPVAGQRVRIASNALDPANRELGDAASQYRVAEWAIVGEGSTSTNIVLTQPLRFPTGISPIVTVGDEARIDAYTTAMNARVMFPDDSAKLLWAGGILAHEDGHDGDGWNNAVLSLRYLKDPVVQGLKITRGYQHGVSLGGTWRAHVDGCDISGLSNNTGIGQYGYSVADLGWQSLVTNCKFSRSRSGYTTGELTSVADSVSPVYMMMGGRIVGAKIVDCVATGYEGSIPFNTHSGGEDITFENCQVLGCDSFAFQGRGRNIRFINPVSRNAALGIQALADFQSTPSQTDFFTNGKTPDDITTVTVINPDFQTRGNAFEASVAVLDIAGQGKVQSASHKLFNIVGGVISLSGSQRLTVGTSADAMPLVAENGVGIFEFTAPNAAYAGAIPVNRVSIRDGADIYISAASTPSTGIRLFNADSTAIVRIAGRLEATLPAATTATTALLSTTGDIETVGDGGIFYTVPGAGSGLTSGIGSRNVRIEALDGTFRVWPLPFARVAFADLTTTDGLMGGTNVFSGLENRLGHRTLLRNTLTAGQTVPTTIPGGHQRASGNILLPNVVPVGYTITICNTSAGAITITAPVGGLIIKRGGNANSMTLPATMDQVTLIAYAADGSNWTVKSSDIA